ncbi:MAG: SDR family oxidoreductase [Bacteroidia bacterium]
METIQGKHILITGATGGIGSEAARLLKTSGARLYLSARNAEALAALARELDVPQERCFVTDLARPSQIADMAGRIHAQTPQLDILINAAGVGIIKAFEQLSPEEFAESLAVNLSGPFLLLKHFIPPMKAAARGLVVNIPGVLGKAPMSGATAYSAAKYGLNGMLKSLREELRRTDVRITNVYLGGVDTPFWERVDLRVQRDKLILAKEAARVIWFVCQQPASGVVSEIVVQPFNHQVL